MSPTLQKILNALEKADSIPAKEKERLRKELEKTEKTLQEKDTLLSSQARELEIEAALERVRAMTMTMQSSKELAMVNTLVVNQINLLINSLYAVGIHICHSEKPMSDAWIGDPVEGQMPYLEFDHSKDPLSIRIYREWKNGNSFHFETLEGKDLIVHFRFMATQIPHRGTFDPTSYPSKLTFHLANFSTGFLVFVTTEECPKEHYIFKRFAKVFEQTYTRFLDLKKAEALAREAQIEAALERVRTRTMAMHKSEELGEVATLLYKEFIALGITRFFNCGFVIVKEKDKLQEGWLTQPGGTFVEPIYLPCPGDAILKKRHKAWTEKMPVFSQSVSGKTLEKHLQYVSKRSTSENQNLNITPYMPDPCFFYCGNFTQGYLHIVSNEDLGQEVEEILAQFSKVFEQTYTRFLDLQKAEAQARDAQIESALEKVRTASMTMQKGEELAEVISVVFTQLKALGVDSEGCGLNLYDKEEGMDMWMSGFGEDVHPKSFYVSFFDHPYYKLQLNDWKKNVKYRVLVFEGDLKKSFDQHTFSNKDFFELPKDIKEAFLAKKKAISSAAYMKYGMLEMIGDKALSDSHGNILCRFAKVFEQTYTRFLDLKKAEALAREAQIEAALERVRTRTMAMHKSEELAETALVLYEQFSLLGNIPDRMSIGIFIEETKEIELWPTDQFGSQLNQRFRGFWKQSAVWTNLYKAWKSGKDSFVADLSGQKLKTWLKFIREEIKLFVDDSNIKGRRVQQAAFFSHGMLLFTTNEPVTEEIMQLLIRFAGVFSQTYTRFLDLQKAENQARQAQIEAALERVRTRTMAMHNTEDIAATVTTFFNEIMGLGLGDSTRSGIGILSQSEKMELWTASVKNKSEVVLHEGLLDMTIHPLLQGVKKAWQAGDPHFTYELSGEDKLVYFRAINKAPEYPIKIDMKKLPETVYHYSFPFRDGSLFVFADEHVQDDIQDIFKRFAAVFGQTYTRYLDLQKAEAQAREAKIEAALERVRASTMAMHKTDELWDVIKLFFKQFELLGLTIDTCLLDLVKQGSNDFNTWIAAGTETYPKQVHLPFIKHPIFTELIKARANKKEFLSMNIGTKSKDRFFDHFYSKATNIKVPKKRKELIAKGTGINTSWTILPHANIGLWNYRGIAYNDEENQILLRMGKVFEQTYRRFLDLQKAEAQAREAHIEAAIEKVRSQSLAMHTTSEMQLVANAVYDQLHELGVVMDVVGMSGVIGEKKDYDVWIGGAPMGKALRIPYNKDTKVQRDYNKAIKDRPDLFARTYKGKVKEEYINHLFTHGEFPKALKKKMVTSAAFSTSIAFAKNSGIQIARYTSEPYTAAENELLKRFAKVFEQAYIRFMDIEKAEAQAREAQIEAALEKVRSASMAMHQTADIGAVVVVFFDQLKQLNIPFEQAWINIFHLGEGYLDTWFSPIDGIYPEPTYFKLPSGPWEETAIKSWKSGAPFSYMSLGTKVEVDQFLEACDEITDSKYFTHIQKKQRYDRLEFLEARHKYGFISKTSKEKPTKEDEDILQRFAKVFEQTYTRFSDIEKAEAQTRESQIQLSLERVRARAMAMQSSDELHEVLGILFQQFDKLEIQPVNVFLSLFDQEARTLTYRASGKSGTRIPGKQVVEVDSMEPLKALYDKWIHDNSDAVEVIYYPKEVLTQLFGIFADTFGSMPEEDRIGPDDFPDGGYSMAGYTPFGYLGYDHQRQATEEEKDILSRFCTEFTRVYQRFLDLKRSEAQGREAQVEAALEKVRSRSLAMQKPEELQEVVAVVGEKLQELGVILDSGGVVICTYFPDSKDVMHWTVTFDPAHPSVPYYLPYFDTPIWKETWASKWESDDDFFEKIFSFKDKNHFFHKAFEISDYKNLPEEHKKELLAVENHALSFAWQTNSALMIPSHNGKLLPEEHKTILKRFAKVFEQAYIRFMDLQKSEAQARESKIEMALEKVRSRTMAMHKSEELGEVAAVLFEQISTLTFAPERFNIAIGNKEEEAFDIWVTDQKGHEVSKRFTFQVDKSPVVREVFNAWEKEPYIIQDLHGKKLQEWVRYMQEEIGLPFDEARLSEHRYINSVFFSHGCIGITTNEPPEAEVLELISRFAKVFQQTYVRFLDLQKAEAQARESQIEVALERVRSRAMAMHHTDELTDVLGVLFDQFDFLEINPVLTHLTLFDEENETFTLRIARGGKKRVIAEQLIDVNAVESWKTSFANWKKSKLHTVDCIDYPPEVLPALWEVLNEVMNALPETQKIYPSDFPDGLYTTQGHCKYGYIGFNHSRRATEEEKDIVIRFAKEFARLYQRFLDIQKAEMQAREAQIEGALERVRSKTMAMHNSEDLEDIVISLFDEVLNLGVDKSIRCGIGILEGHEGMETRSVNSNPDGTVDLKVGMLNMTIHPMLVGLKKAWKNGKKGYSYQYTAKDVRKYYEALNNEPEYPFNADLKTLPEQEFHRSFFYSSGILFAFSENPISEESSKVLARFAAVFGQTYRRFLDLQKAEERAKDALKQASLDRVRGQIASMRSSEDLERITPLVWNELTTLGIPFIRCGVFIIDEADNSVQAFLSTPDGQSLGAMRIPVHADKDTAATVAHWKRGEVYRTHWDKKQFLEFMQTMTDLGQVKNQTEYQGAEQPPESLHLHFVPFTQGMMYVGNTEPLVEEQIELVDSLADAFAIAYARYEDFSKLEKSKERVETTLSDLKATQNQLVQSEKMASLGELTAGIAHEIQNPLNFVNNFSEVSVELIEEMQEELDKGDMAEAMAIIEDIKQNLDKINHHGKRADGIVKGMLQHSRASSGEKEPTDLNVLADEYLRLAYHGLRAKDKSFNATLETHFDESIGKVNVLAQDMGRVILNLITNAFYAVKEKKEKQPQGYEPTVTVTTRKEGNKVQIVVKDNGNGIPDTIKEKIFQPFFTTKPTGQGTGLGLSMSYDIITKGHGGELEVNTKEGEGSVFTISIPLAQKL